VDRRALTGRTGEDAAADVYARRGYRLLARNWRCRVGELDLVVARGDTLVVVEVKTRRGATFGAGYEAVHAGKRRKLRALAEVFLQTPGVTPAAVRFDVASVTLGGRSPSVEIFEDAF
jgi:putative endonuclease